MMGLIGDLTVAAWQYHPTPEIQTATINWGFKSNADVVRVEVTGIYALQPQNEAMG
jgi:hypothetical protein